MASDNFNRANETPISSPWAFSGGSGVNLASNHMVSNASPGERVIYYSGSVAGADQYSEAEVFDRSGTSNDWGPAVRCNSEGFSAYWSAGYDPTSTRELYKVVSGSFSSVSSFVSATGDFVNGDVLRVEAEGNTLRYIKNGVTERTATDASLPDPGDGAGVFFYDANMDIDNWQGGNLGGGGGTPQLLGASIGGTLGLTPALRVAKPLAATVDGTLGMSPSLRAEKQLAANIDSSLGASPALRVAKSLAATMDGTLGVTPALLVSKPLAATVDGTLGMSPSLRAEKQLAANIDGTLGITPSLSVSSAVNLAAVIDAVSGLAAALKVQKSLQAVIDTTSGITANLRVSKPLAAVMDSSLGLTPSLTVGRALAAVISASSALTPSLRVGKNLAATVTGTSGLVASLTVGAASVVRKARMMMGAGR